MFNVFNEYIFSLLSRSGGLSPGDIVTKINGKEVHTTSDIYSILSEKGKALTMTIYRGTQKLEITIVPEEIED